MLHKHTAYKYENPYKSPYLITWCFTNVTINLQCGAIQITYNICRINPYKYDTNVEDYNPKNMSDDVNI